MRTSTAPLADASDARGLQPIRLYLAEMVLVASVSPGDERMTDILNHGGELRVLPSGAEPWQPDSWVSVPIDEIEIVVPPRHVSPAHKRIERDRQLDSPSRRVRPINNWRYSTVRLVGAGRILPPLVVPPVLPSLLDLIGELRVVAMLGRFVAPGHRPPDYK
jgi:hypothetical protein